MRCFAAEFPRARFRRAAGITLIETLFASTLGAYRTAYDTLPALTANCRQSSCSRHELAAFHVALWKCRLGRWTQRVVCRDVLKTRGLLPQGDGRMEPSGAGIRGEIRWVGADHEPRSLKMGHALLRR